jgi:ketosteroid isomerase-like protein
MSNGSLALEFFEKINRRSLDQMKDSLNEDARLFFPKAKPFLGRDRITRFFEILFRQYSELQFEVQRVITEENRVAVHWTNQGITKKKEPYENEGVTLFEFEGGKIAFISDFFKNTEKF